MSPERIAIVGIGCVFPGAADAAELWRNICAGVDAISDAPAQRWDPVFFDPDDGGLDRFYCRRGGFVDDVADFDPTAFGIMPIAVDGGEPDQFLALAQAAAALDDSARAHERVSADRIGVVVGRGGYRTPGVARLDQRVHVAQQLIEALQALLPEIDPARLAQVRKEFVAQLGTERPEAAIGLVPNLAASRIANRFDFQGPAYTVDAACASTLLAVDHALTELRRGRCDLVLAGGVHHCHDVTLWSVFSQLKALSPSQQIRPFSRQADGVLIGEGTGFFVLKRLADAERDDDRIYAVVCGSGISSDGRSSSLMSPNVDGQVRAMAQAWHAAQLDPATVGLVEAHGTGTPAGDETELAGLRAVFGSPNGHRAGLGSIKSMIGHAMPAAGAAGLAKAALALHHRVLPPTLHVEDPHPLVDQTMFRLLTEPESWESDGPRRAAVNAFGFGGIDAHLVLEEHGAGGPSLPFLRKTNGSDNAHPAPTQPERDLPPTLLLAGKDTLDLQRRLAEWVEAHGAEGTPSIAEVPADAGPARLAIVDLSPRRLRLAQEVVAQGLPWRGRNGVWFEPRGLLHDDLDDGTGDRSKLAFLFPGVEPSFDPRIDDVAQHFGLETLAAGVHQALSAPVSDLERQSRAIVAVGRVLHKALSDLGVTPDLVAGHSLGEWSGEIATGVVPEEQVDEFLDQLQPREVEFPDVVFMALGCSAEVARELVADLAHSAVSHDNCPHQSVVCGPAEEIDTVGFRAKTRKVLAQELPFRSGFHSPLFADHIEALADTFAALPVQAPAVPLWSATTCQPYPTEPAALRALAARHLVEPVRFRELTKALFDDGARVFVQVGVGNLTGFVEDTLHDEDVAVVAANSPKRSGLAQLCQVGAALWVQGTDVTLERLGRAAPADNEPPPRRGHHPLDLGNRLVRELTPLSEPCEPPVRPPVTREERSMVRQRQLSLDVEPAWADHAFFRQPADWPHPEDRFPLVPMTGIIQLLVDGAIELYPELVPVGVEEIAAFRWLTVDPAVEVTLRAATLVRADADAALTYVKAAIDGHARATVVMAERYPTSPATKVPQLVNGRPSHIDASRFYTDRHMFHGPAFQGVEEFLTVADNGSRALLRSLAAPGALLDNAGQLMGHWLSAQDTADRLVLPTSIERIEFFGPQPPAGTLIDCTVTITRLDDKVLRGDIALLAKDRLWCRISGWEDRRFGTDALVFQTLQWPERSGMSVDAGDFTVVEERWHDTATRDLVMRRYLGREERADYERHHPLAQRQFLLGRIAVKDAVRRWLWSRGHGPLFPAEVHVANDANGRPLVRGPFRRDLRVSLAHVEGLAVAQVAEDADVGIDVELVEPRRSDFEQLVLTDGERGLRADGYSRDAWLTCLWALKEASAKATGRGLNGRPKDFEITTLEEKVACVGGRGVAFERLSLAGNANGDEPKEHIVAWTC